MLIFKKLRSIMNFIEKLCLKEFAAEAFMHITTLFIWFILYSILGWIYETIYCSVKDLKWDNRGMLNGPYCPIYGVGAVLDVLLCSGLPNHAAVFFACMAGSAILEYATSYATEQIFHAVWWDYSRIPFNLNGRICLSCSLGFGVAGLVVLNGVHPYMVLFTDLIPIYWQEPLALVFMAVFAADCALTADSLAELNVKLEAVRKAIDLQIAEKYNTFIENTKQNLSDSLNTIKEKISPEEFRERRIWEELKRMRSTMNWAQRRALRSSVSFRKASYSDLGNQMRHIILFCRKKEEDDSELETK